jgi:hypothetical protein
MKTTRSQALLVLCFLLGAVTFAFSLDVNRGCFGVAADGAAWQAYLDYQVRDRAPFSQTGVDAHQGDFDAYYPLINDYTIPGALYRFLEIDHAPPPTAIYGIYSVALFLTVLLLAGVLGIEFRLALLGAFISVFFFPPLLVYELAPVFRFLHLNPHWMQLMIFSVLTVLSFWQLDGKWSASRLVLICAPAISLTIQILSVGAMVIFTPAVIVFGAVALIVSKSRAEIAQKLLAAGLTLLILIVTGEASYLRGMEAYSAYQVFGDEFDWDLPYAVSLSILFIPPFGTALVVLGTAGAIVSAVSGTGRLRQFAVAHLLTTGLFFGGVTAFFIWTYYRGYRISPPIYFENTLLPFHAVFAAVALGRIINLLLHAGNTRRHRDTAQLAASSGAIALWLFVVTISLYSFSAVALGRPDNCSPNQIYPHIASNPIVRVLHDEIALFPGKPFRGSEVTIDWAEDRPGIDFSEMNERNGIRRVGTGNDLRLSGLWRYDIPTMYQYFTFITAPYYLLLTEFLARPEDIQTRSGLLLTRIDPKMLRLWGVRFVVTDHPTEVGRELVLLPLPKEQSVRLIELSAPNFGNYTPTSVRRVADFYSGLAVLHEASFDGTKLVVTDVTDEPIEEPLAPASEAHLTYETYGFHITAASTAKSVLVLPPQFSRCWSVEGSGSPRLFRANLMQLGVHFSGKLDAKLVFRYGPLFASECRLRDINDMKRLDIAHGRFTPRALQSRPG